MVKTIVRFISLVLISSSVLAGLNSSTTLIPGNTGGMYYKLGGGNVIPLPYTPETNNVNLSFSGNAGLGFDCDNFDPTVSIINSLNGIGNSFKNIASTVWNHMTKMLIAESGYLMAKAMPNVYKFAKDGISFGQFNYSLGDKSCEAMLADVNQGKDPVHDYIQEAKKSAWQTHMSLANTQAAKNGFFGASTGDVANIRTEVAKDGGKSGIEWIHGNTRNSLQKSGGANQTPIYLTQDTIIAGYNVLINTTRAYSDFSAPVKTDANARLVSTFPDPKQAAAWVVKVVGEQIITTYSGGSKKSIPGIGLLNDVQDQTTVIKNKLINLVDGTDQLTLDNLKAVSPPKIVINDNVIEMLRKQSNSLLRAIYVNKIAEEVAVAKVIDKAKLALQLLEVGQQVPPIFASSAAQKGIEQDKARLKQWIADLRANPKDNVEFVGNTIASLIQSTGAEESASASIRPSVTAPVMEHGAIKVGQ